MIKPEPVENEFQMVDGRVKGSKKSERELYLNKQANNLKEQLNQQLDKVNALKKTFKNQMDKLKSVNDKLQEDNMLLVEKHDARLIRYMDLSDQADVMEAALDKLGYDPRGKALPEKAASSDEEGSKTGAPEVLEEAED